MQSRDYKIMKFCKYFVKYLEDIIKIQYICSMKEELEKYLESEARKNEQETISNIFCNISHRTIELSQN